MRPDQTRPQALHLVACLTNSLGLVLTLTTLSSNTLHLTTSLLDGYVSGQVQTTANSSSTLHCPSGGGVLAACADGLPWPLHVPGADGAGGQVGPSTSSA